MVRWSGAVWAAWWVYAHCTRRWCRARRPSRPATACACAPPSRSRATSGAASTTPASGLLLVWRSILKCCMTSLFPCPAQDISNLYGKGFWAYYPIRLNSNCGVSCWLSAKSTFRIGTTDYERLHIKLCQTNIIIICKMTYQKYFWKFYLNKDFLLLFCLNYHSMILVF